MSLHRFGRVLIGVGLVLGATACSEQGVMPTSPVAPSSQAGTAAKPPAPPPPIPVTATVADGTDLHIQSDGGGAYLNSKTLKSEIPANGDWVFDTIFVRNATRTISLRFTSPIAGSAPGGGDPVPLPEGLYKFRVMALCSVPTTSGGPSHPLQNFTQGQVEVCPVRIGFDVGSDRYVLLMNSSFATINGPQAGTDDVTVTCTASSSGACSTWLLTPSNPSGANAAKLWGTNRNGDLVEDRGNFSMKFSIQIVKQ